ncbi:MAG: hypothetical protein HQK98_03415, partial [Nitrospirae bacterium]|nr:hypothetical protein [Nitrospirota bacterium]
DSNTPVQVSGLTGVTAVAGGFEHTIALTGDGTVWAWGYNGYGQLGDGTNTNSNTPVQVSGLTGVTAVAGGAVHSVALRSDGTVWAWGLNQYGQLGNGTNTNSNTPVQVSGLTGVTAVAAGFEHSVALKSDGTVWAWGYNGYGQLGNGTNTNSNTPVQVLFNNTYSLNVTKSGTGTGTITSSLSGISCGAACSASYTSGTSVVLTAAADSGSTFTSWTGCDSTNGSQCTVAIVSNKSVSAAFTSSGSSDYDAASAAINTIYSQYASFFGTKSGGIVTAASSSATYYVQWFTNGAALVAWTDGYMYTYYNGTWYALGTTWKTSDLDKATAMITQIYNQYASFFGTKSGGIVTGTAGTVTYYVQWFTNGAALVAWTDGYMYTYYNSTWYALGVSWKTTSDLDKATVMITQIYNQYTSFFGTKSGGIVTGASGSATYYVQWCTNGTAIVAWTDGTMYTYYNGTWYALGVGWK